MTRMTLLTAVCGLALAACSGGDDTAMDDAAMDDAAMSEAETTETGTDGATEVDAEEVEAGRERRAEAQAEARAEVAAIVEQARDCEIPDDWGLASFEEPEGEVTPQENAELSERFMRAALSEDCMWELPSGLAFRIREASDDGISPETGDLVTVHYRGLFPWGEEFDSSYARGEPATFPSDRLITGWVEALPLMRTGEKWELYIRPELGYGTRGTPGGPIGPNQALVFELELLDVPSAGQ